jgi:ABC-2 type transport system permease protein
MSMRAALRAYPALLRVGFASAVAYRAEFLIWMFSTNMPLVMLAIWSAVAREGPVAGYTQRGFTAYYLTTLLVRMLTGSWVVWELTMEIRQGTLALRLLRPLHPLIAYSAENLAAVPLRGLIAIPLVALLLGFAGRDSLAHDPALWAIFVPAMLGAWLLTFLVMALVGTLSLYVESAVSLFEAWLGLSAVLSGYLVPLDLFPPALGDVARVLPFRFLLSFPVEVLLGRVTPAHALSLLAAQWGYVGLALIGTLALWRAGMRRFGAYGG